MRQCGTVLLALVLVLALGPVRVLAAQPAADGQYTIEVTLSGGTGRVSITSPVALTVANGEMTAAIVWSSPYYEYMLVDGVQYDPIQTEGNSTFEIPVVLDESMAVSAQTIAMSQPHEIEYTLYLDSATMKPLNEGWAVVDVVLVAAAICVAVALAVCVVVATRRKQRGKSKKGSAE